MEIGQFKKSDLTSYMETINYSFLNNTISINNDKLQEGLDYFLNFSVKRTISAQQIIIYLRQSNGGIQQKVKEFTIGKGEGVLTIDLTFNPIDTFDKIVFEGDGVEIQIFDLAFLKNILSTIGKTQLHKIGIQGPVGLLMSINGEEIRIGPSGIYEMDYNIPITSVCFAITNNEVYFVMDYQYKDKGVE